jgi:hypothetical protein
MNLRSAAAGPVVLTRHTHQQQPVLALKQHHCIRKRSPKKKYEKGGMAEGSALGANTGRLVWEAGRWCSPSFGVAGRRGGADPPRPYVGAPGRRSARGQGGGAAGRQGRRATRRPGRRTSWRPAVEEARCVGCRASTRRSARRQGGGAAGRRACRAAGTPTDEEAESPFVVEAGRRGG